MVILTQLTAIAAKHGLTLPRELPEPWTGAASQVYPLTDVVVKVPFDRPDAIRAVTTDAAIVPVARGLGVPVPELVAFDDSREVLPMPFAIFHRVEGAEPLDPGERTVDARSAWFELGRQLAKVHAVTDPAAVPVELPTFRQAADIDPRLWVDELRAASRLASEDARWLRDLLDRLAPSALADIPLALCHGDANAANVLVDERSGQLRALIDWGSSGWFDPVWDFARVPLDAVPWMLAGHRAVAPLPNDVTAEARILWCQVQMRLFSVRKVTDLDDAEAQIRVHVERLSGFVRATGLDPLQ